MRAFTLVAAVLAAASAVIAQSPSAGPSCSYTCPESDSVYNELVSYATQGYDLVCTYVSYSLNSRNNSSHKFLPYRYDGYGTCTYNEVSQSCSGRNFPCLLFIDDLTRIR